MNTWKILQRKAYDVLSHKYFLIGVFPSCLLSVLLLSIIEIGEVWMVWSGKSANGKLSPGVLPGRCGDLIEIDAVYTWVNGSDPLLLRNLRIYHDEESQVEPWTECPHLNCVPSHFVVYRSCEPLSRALENLFPAPYELQKTNISLNHSHFYTCPNITSLFITFLSVNDASEAMQIKNLSRTLFHGFWTTDMMIAGSIPCLDWISLSGFVSRFPYLTSESIKKKLSKQLNVSILEVWSYPEQGLIILKLQNSQAVESLIGRQGKYLINNDVVSAKRLALVLYNPYHQRQDRYAPSRFEDKEELRYSLRSLQQHAPWIRHVYLVTNGQIPYWLNLDHPQITLVTHEDIFVNKSHLPTFSSPAIESHLHRIEGLSERFLYLNDDIMFAQDVWPEDFFTNSRGYKVYLSWPVPDCSPSCLWSWVSDGSCDAECNVEECGFDGGDCNETDSHSLAHVVREDFSIYDDVPSREFPPDFDSVIMGKQVMGAEPEYLEPPDLIQSNLEHPVLIDIPKSTEKFSIATYNNKSAFLFREVNQLHREKRGAVKKNLGSHEYIGSSMLAGQSADFLGSVTNSNSAIKKALQVANNLRRGEILIPGNSDVNVKENSTSIAHVVVRQANEDRERYVNDQENFFGDSISVNKNFKTGPKPRDDFIDNQSPKKINASLEGRISQIFKSPDEKRNSIRNKTAVSKNLERLLKEAEVGRNSYQFKRKNLRTWMENDLNESAASIVANKGYTKPGKMRERILDSFAESLLHVNMLYNQVYGFEARRVPAHTPHFIDKRIMCELQEKFGPEWEETSSHRLRSPHDMQFAFSYYYFLMSEEEDIQMEELFNNFDTDHSGTWSDREIRTLLTRLYPAPLNPHHLIQFEEIVLKCSKNLSPSDVSSSMSSTPMYERYQDSPLPTVTWSLVSECPELKKLLRTHLGRRMKYKFEVVREWSRDITFKMLNSNVSHLVGFLDDIRRNPKKFVCLNDNLDSKQESENAMVRAVLRDFYHSFFPTPSKFELPPDMRNRFLHVEELNEWKKNRSKLRTAVVLAVITLCLLTLAVVCPDEFRHYGRRVFELSCPRRRRISRTRKRSTNSCSTSYICPSV